MCKLESDLVVPVKPLFYRCYVDDPYVPRKKIISDMFLENLNSYYQNILTIELNPLNFLDTELIREKGCRLMQVFNESHKFPVQWSYKITIR